MRSEITARESSQFTHLPNGIVLQRDYVLTSSGVQTLLARIIEDLNKLSNCLSAILHAQQHSSDGKGLALQKSVTPFRENPAASLKLLPQIHPDSESAQGRNLGAVFTFDGVTVDFEAMEARRHGTLVTLKAKEFKLLTYLVRNAGRVISREELLKEVWGYECYPNTRTVDNHILHLRQKLEPEPSHPRHLLTVHGAGYKFILWPVG